MENTLQVHDIMKITNDVEADEVLEQIREIRAETKRFEMIANARIEHINQQLESQIKKLDNEEKFLLGQLRAYSLGVHLDETKTQKKYKLLSGELIIKKPTVKIEIIDREKLTQYAEESAENYIKIKKDVDWAGLKKVLDIDGEKVINKETGEVLGDSEGLAIKEVGEIFEIKL